MKKWLAIFLLIITTAGTIIPCCVADDCSADELISSTQHDEDKEEGACSPFFACATCPGFVQMAQPLQLPDQEVPKQKHYAGFLLPNLSTYSPSLFQPPKAG